VGKTYDSADSIAEFFKQRNRQMGQTAGSLPKCLKQVQPTATSSTSTRFTPGSYVKHSKYGRGLVLRREGAGESTKANGEFPGLRAEEISREVRGFRKSVTADEHGRNRDFLRVICDSL
jgi:hypothetical protein